MFFFIQDVSLDIQGPPAEEAAGSQQLYPKHQEVLLMAEIRLTSWGW